MSKIETVCQYCKKANTVEKSSSVDRYGLKPANPGSHAHELLQITKLATVFEVFDKAEEAITSFNRAATTT